ncbi:MAG: arginase family protein [Bacteroidales bacterium]|nr:arginase family protein [Bacteroidales bacterium]
MKSSSTLRLIYPQWQGGIITSLVTEVPADDASRGYYLGSHLLNFLAPRNGQKTVEVPVSLDVNDRKVKNGINAYDVILQQTKDALSLLNENDPERIITLGGDCSASVVPFTYLAAKYPDDVAIVWIDAHPDINVPGDAYEGYHAMALAACFGKWDDEIIRAFPAKTEPAKALVVGLNEFDPGIDVRLEEWGVKSLHPAETVDNSNAVLEWLKGTGASKVMIHFDLDVIDPAEMIAAVGIVPGGMKIDQLLRVIRDISAEYDIVSLTVAEPMPRVAIKIKNILDELPLLKD